MLNVFFEDRLVGSIENNSYGRMVFEYASEWLSGNHQFPLSQSLPLDGSFSKGLQDHNYFANLLPEGNARISICRELGIHPDNDFSLLKKIGGDCAGAIQVIPEDTPRHSEVSYKPVSHDSLVKAARSFRRTGYGSPSGIQHRLSLAGAQDKWPVYVDSSSIYLPVQSSPSSHIVKFSSRQYKNLPSNEAFSTYIAGRLGLRAAEVRAFDGYSMSERFDRTRSSTGALKRIHQEDFCQALGYAPTSKYESEGGPRFYHCMSMLRKVSSSPAEDILSLIRWQITNILIGNADGHAKNIALLYTPDGPRLSPFYDIVCTRVYPDITADSAFSVGGVFDPGHIRKKDWEVWAEELGMRPSLIIRLVEETASILSNQLDSFLQDYNRQWGPSPIIDQIASVIRKQIRRTKTLMT